MEICMKQKKSLLLFRQTEMLDKMLLVACGTGAAIGFGSETLRKSKKHDFSFSPIEC